MRDYEAAAVNEAARSLQDLIGWLNGYYELPHHFYATEQELKQFGEVFHADLHAAAKATTASLRRYVDSWLAADRQFDRWMKANPRLFEEINRNLKSVRLYLGQDKRSNPMLRTQLRLELVGKKPLHRRINPSKEASWFFCQLLTSPLREQVIRCKRCSKYLLIESLRMNKVFCSRKCATGFTAINSTRRRRQQEKQRKILRVRDAMVRLGKLKKRPTDWKDRVADRAGVTRKWLTRALRRADLLPWTDIQ